MAFQSGSQVNAALGRTDFTPFLQGAMQGAQAQARGAENIARGLAGLGQQVASGIEKYYKKQEEKQIKQQGVDYLVNNFGVTPAAAAAGYNAIGPVAFTNLLESKRKEQRDIDKQNRIASYFNALNASGGRAVSPEGGPVSSAEEMAARQEFAALQKMESETYENLVNRTKPVATVYPTMESAREAGEAANPNAEIFVIPSSDGNFTFVAQKKTPDQRPLRPTSIEEKGNAISEARKLFAAGNRTGAADKLNSIGQFLTNNLGERLVITGKTVSQFFEDEEDLSDDDLINLYLPETPGKK